MKAKEKMLVFSPLFLFAGYVLRLVSQVDRPFLLRWIEGSFGLFVALVFCNVLRKSVLEAGGNDPGENEAEAGDGEEGPGGGLR